MSIFKSTTSYGKGFRPAKTPDEYLIKIYTGGSAGANAAEDKALIEIGKFMKSNSYTDYRILSRKFNFFPSYYKFLVKFR